MYWEFPIPPPSFEHGQTEVWNMGPEGNIEVIVIRKYIRYGMWTKMGR